MENKNNQRKLRVFYGWAKLNNTIKKKSLRVIFENENHNIAKNDIFIRKALQLVHTRYQTEDESKDAEGHHRVFSCYETFIDKSPFKGDLDKLLLNNFNADSNHVSVEERQEILIKLRKAYFEHYKIKSYPPTVDYVNKDKSGQLKILFL